jgi:hypothetical protein
MKKTTFFLIVISIALLFTSCQREIDWGLINKTRSDSIYINSLVILDSFIASPNDTAVKFLFDYDNQKRLSRLREFHYVSNTTDFTSDIRFSYTANDTLPSVLYSIASYNYPVYDTAYLSYITGKITRDSSAYGISGSPKSFVKIDFLQSGNGLYTGNYIDSVAGFPSSSISVNSYVNWQNGNLLTEIDTLHFPGAADQIESKFYTYDQKPNPLHKALLSFPITAYYFNTLTSAHGNWYLKAFVNYSANNILTELYNPSNELITWVYTYGANGLPKLAIRQRALSLRKVLYNYISL